jgi:hypothetical protein
MIVHRQYLEAESPWVRNRIRELGSLIRRRKRLGIAIKVLAIFVLMPGSGSLAALVVWYVLTTLGQRP